MTPRSTDWHYLGRGLKRPAALLVACATLWGASTAYRADMDGALDNERQLLAGLEEERRDITTRRDARRQFAALYRQLQADGIVGREHRLAWIQTTRDAGRDLALPYVRYSTSPQRALEAPWLSPGVSAPVLESPMELQLGLVHEQDLLRLFDRLRQSPGLFQVRSCALERLGQDASPEPDKANVTGTCEVAWLSLPRGTSLTAAVVED